ncbi:MAG: tyrosine-protein phosphatase [Desulfovibrio sp.]|nr:tyrosine-protein phosphatase [Desulfovibrio sp.]
MKAYARIERNAATKAAALDILVTDNPVEAAGAEGFCPLDAVPGRWILHAGGTAAGLSPLAEGTGPGRFPLPGAGREYLIFALRLGGGLLFLAERRLPMAGGFNIRDLGGYAGADGRRVIWGRVLRADDLKNLTPEDLDYLSGLPLRTVLDFRGPEEAARSPDRLPPSVARSLLRPIPPARQDAEALAFSPEEAEAFMLDIYRHLALGETPAAVYRELFHILQWEDESSPLLFHCAAGKDRTGFAAALFLHSLGVAPEIILDDYLASNRYLAGKYANPGGIFSVRPSYLRAALEAVDRAHGSLDAYLKNTLGVDKERMRRLYLEPGVISLKSI